MPTGVGVLSDLALIARCHQGDGEAVAQLITRYMPLVRSRAAGFYGPNLERDDLTQEGFLALLKCIRSFNPERQPSFAAFADKCVRNRLSTVVRRSIAGNSLSQARNLGIPEGDDGFFDPAACLIRQEDAAALRKKIESLLSVFEQDVLNMYLSGHSYKQIALRLHASAKAVDNALQRARRKLRSA